MAMPRYLVAGLLTPLALSAAPLAADDLSDRLRVPPGFSVERVAGEPLIRFPMFAAWDDRGRLYVAESSGNDLYEELSVQARNCRVTRLEDRDGDGRFDHAEVFADDLVFPMGLAWRDGALYVADPPDLVAFVDRDGDGRADDRTAILGGFGHRDNGSLHGLIFGPDDRLYMTMGNPDGYRLHRADGTVLAGTNGALLRCNPDGSGPEVVSRGFTNLVEVAFLPDGSIIGTDNWFQDPSGGLRDALVHLVEGALYPQNSYTDETFHVVTGEPLPPVSLLPVTGISGVARLRGPMWPEAMRGDLLSAQHNTRKVARHVLVRRGSTKSSRDASFLTTDDPDFHPSDVLEDADGSLLVIDTGAWYVQHCPTGKIRPTRAPGGIYRVRHETPRSAPSDPWGLALDWDGATEAELADRLADPRPMVADRAVAELARRPDRAPDALRAWLPTADDREVKQRAFWLLARCPGPTSAEALRSALDGDDAELVMVAARCLALVGDRGGEPRLRTLLSAPDPAVRLAAAEALAHCGGPSSLDALWDALAERPDPFLEHALIYAASKHADAAGLRSALERPEPDVQRAALLLLDQPPHACLDREALVARTGADDPRLRRTALEILERHSEWADHAAGLIRSWLRDDAPSPEQRQRLDALVQAFQGREEVAGLVARGVAGDEPGISGPGRRLLLEAMVRSLAAEVPPAWSRAIGRALDDPDPAIRNLAAATAAALAPDEHAPRLAALAEDAVIDDGLRLVLLRAVARSRPRPSPEAFGWLLDRLGDAGRPVDQLAAAEVLARSELAPGQLERVLSAARDEALISPSVLLPLLGRPADDRTAAAIVAFLAARVDGGWRPPEGEVEALVERLPAAARPDAERLLDRLHSAREQQAEELARYLPLIRGGDPERGRAVYFGEEAACSACHRIGTQGGAIGPDLTGIGASRSAHDLLESILFPGSTIAQGFENYLVETVDGQLHSGIIGRQTQDLVVLLDSTRQERRIARNRIERMQRQSTSIMPDGLGLVLSSDQLRDLLAFLQDQTEAAP
ncbi:PVC-type heme-binding CxxCH protein [Tautonia plasticadhaerens]|uniref:Cytochrome c n=1 Tax=Tautonia plasticadhaerens TaxID=2527974 RepID=A0A518HA97_9BACT|nr:PVC-type heme-binding CxxCH protein [Tautonia plasticadhaerens]QDV37774.1 Cytochrome c [Tautonia plasticadhaerens]